MWTVSEVEESHECYPRGEMNSLVIKGIKKNPADFQGVIQPVNGLTYISLLVLGK